MKVLANGKAIIIGKEQIDLNAFPGLKVLGCPMTGIAHLPLGDCQERGIKVISLAAPRDEETSAFLRTITSTAEHTIGLIIALARNYKTALNGPYELREYYKGSKLAGKTLGILGLGRIGVQVANIAVSMGMKTIYRDALSGLSLPVLLQESDFLTVHIPLPDNEGFFTKEMFCKMKPSAVFINTSRSKVVEDGALLWALKNKVIAGAAVDFIDDPGLLDYERTHSNLLLTNHLGGCTYEDTDNTEAFILKKVEEYLKIKHR